MVVGIIDSIFLGNNKLICGVVCFVFYYVLIFEIKSFEGYIDLYIFV